MNQDIKEQIIVIESQFENLIKDFERKHRLIRNGAYRVLCEYGDSFDGCYSHCEIETNNTGTNIWITIFVCFNGIRKKKNGKSFSARCFMDDIVKIEELIY